MVVRYLLAEVGKQVPVPSSEDGGQTFLDSPSSGACPLQKERVGCRLRQVKSPSKLFLPLGL